MCVKTSLKPGTINEALFSVNADFCCQSNEAGCQLCTTCIKQTPPGFRFDKQVKRTSEQDDYII